MAAAVQITDTGLRGFLKWARSQYPAEVYQQIAAQIQQHIPQAFSGYMLGGWRTYLRRRGLGDTGADGTATVDTADAANSTASSPSWSDMISQIIGTATGAYLNVEQQKQNQQIVTTQLQQAQNGKTPLPISLSSSGITFGQAGASLGTIAVLAIVGFLGYRLVTNPRYARVRG